MAEKVKKRARKVVPHGRVCIDASANNTIVTVTDLEGNALGWSSSGACGFKGTRKSTPYAAQVAAEKAMEKVGVYGLEKLDIVVNGIGVGRDQAIRGLQTQSNVEILSITDRTGVPHGGCRKRKSRRV